MTRKRIGQVALTIAALVHFALIRPLTDDLWRSHWFVGMNRNDCERMFLSFMMSLGFFLLLAIRKPHEHRSLIVFAAWYSFFHAFVMAIETIESWNHGVRRDYTDVVVAVILGLLLLVVHS